MQNLTPELIAKAKGAKSAKELLALAKENNVELTEEDAKTYFAQLSASSIVSDDELEAVAGGDFLGISCPGEEEDSLVGKTVRVRGGTQCPGCNGAIGVLCKNPTGTDPCGSSMYVKCTKCNLIITNYVNSDNIQVI